MRDPWVRLLQPQLVMPCHAIANGFLGQPSPWPSHLATLSASAPWATLARDRTRVMITAYTCGIRRACGWCSTVTWGMQCMHPVASIMIM